MASTHAAPRRRRADPRVTTPRQQGLYRWATYNRSRETLLAIDDEYVRWTLTGPDGTRYDNRMVFLKLEAPRLLEMDHGHGIPWKGNYSSWLEQKQQRLEKEEKEA